MPALVEIHAVSKRYGSVIALNDLTLTMDRPATTGLVGKNGAGKTTLLSILSGVIKPTQGEVKIIGNSPGDPALLGKVSTLIQDAEFKKGVPVITQLKHFARLQGLSRREAEQEITRLLQQFDNVDYVNKKPEAMSVGQRKRMGIVQALISGPELVLLDEPTAGLDPVAAHDIREYIQSLSINTSFIISSHNLYEIEDICSSVIILDKGKLVANTEITELADKHNTLNITLDRAASAALQSTLNQLPEITEIIVHKSDPGKITIHYTSTLSDQFQLQLQSLINEQGAGIINLSRGKSLTEGVIGLVEEGTKTGS